MQIDVLTIEESGFVKCNLYTESRCVTIFMSKSDYDNLIKDKFFIRDGKNLDSANVLNTTATYQIKIFE